MGKQWTAAEDDIILAHYDELGIAETARLLGRTEFATSGRARTLEEQGKRQKSRRVAGRKQVKSIREFIVKNYEHMTEREMTDALSISTDSVHHHVKQLQADGEIGRKVHAWSEEFDDFLKANYPLMPLKEIANDLGVTYKRVEYRIRYLKKRGEWPHEESKRGRKWTPEEDAQLLEHYQQLANDELAKIVGRTEAAVAGQLKRLGLRRTRVRAKYVRKPPSEPKISISTTMPASYWQYVRDLGNGNVSKGLRLLVEATKALE